MKQVVWGQEPRAQHSRVEESHAQHEWRRLMHLCNPWTRYGLGTLLLAPACLLAMRHPVCPWSVLGLSVGGFLVTLARPCWTGFLFPVVLVAADAYPLTGQILIREYDPILLAVTAGMLCRCQPARQPHTGVLRTMWPWALWTVSLLLSGVIGWRALEHFAWGDQLSVYFGQQNVLRIAKGSLWGTVFAWIVFSVASGASPIREESGEPVVKFRRFFAWGIQFAMLYVGVWILAERYLFESLFDFSRELRATGPFFTMHIGDQHVDAFIVLALPFAWMTLSGRVSAGRITVTVALTCLMVYAALATMSRATIAAVGAQLMLLAGYWGWRVIVGRGTPRRVACVLVSSVVVVLIGSGLLVFQRGDAILDRFLSLRSDLETRVTHWRNALAGHEESVATLLLGRGVGTFPTHMAREQGRSLPPLRWIPAGSGGAIELQPGWPIYLEQLLVTDSDEPIALSVAGERLTSSGNATLHIVRCRKTLLSSFECRQLTCDLPVDSPKRFALRRRVAAPRGSKGNSVRQRLRPQTVALYVGGDTGVRVHEFAIGSDGQWPGGKTTSQGSSPWFFTCDDHLAWRTKNAVVHLLFEQGLLGTAAFAVLVFGACRYRRDSADPVGGYERWIRDVSLFGFAVVAFFGTLIDTPWIMALLMCILAILSSRRASRPGTSPSCALSSSAQVS